MIAAAAAVLRIVLRVDARAVAIGQSRLNTGIGIRANTVLAETAAADHAAETAIVGVMQQVGATAVAPVGNAGAGIYVERLVVIARHVAAAIVAGNVALTVAMRFRIGTAGVDDRA